MRRGLVFDQLAARSKHLIGFRKDRREAVFLICAVHLAIVRDWHLTDIRGTATICPLLDKSGHWAT